MVLLAEEEMVLRRMIDRLIEIGKGENESGENLS
jgi:hypothetical protein